MTDEQVLALKPGDVVALHTNGLVWRHRIREITARGTCTNERSGAYGHAWACYRADWLPSRGDGAPLAISTSLRSDDYSRGEGYPTHDRDGARIRGWELLTG